MSTRSGVRSEEHTSELQSPDHLVCRLLLEKKNPSPLLLATLTAAPSVPVRHVRTNIRSCACNSVSMQPLSTRHTSPWPAPSSFLFFFNDTATTEIYTLSLHDALPIYRPGIIPSHWRVRTTVHLGMRPGMVYEYPLWGVGLLLVGLAAVGAVFLDLAARQFLSLEFRRRHNDVAAASALSS